MSYFTKEDISANYYGHEEITITEEDIRNLKKGIKLYTDVNGEYTIALEYEKEEESEESAEVAGLDLKIEIVTLLQDIIDMGGTGAKKGTYDDGWDSAIGEVVNLFAERFSLQIDNGEQQEEDEK